MQNSQNFSSNRCMNSQIWEIKVGAFCLLRWIQERLQSYGSVFACIYASSFRFNQNWLSYWNAFHSLDFVATGDGTPKWFFPSSSILARIYFFLCIFYFGERS